MRRPLSYLLLVLLSGCLGFQPVALALGARCAHGSWTEMRDAVPNNVQSMHEMHDMSGHKGHGQHVRGAGDASDSPQAGLHGCECGCDCAMPGCLGNAPALAQMNSSPLISASAAVDVYPESLSRLRPAHGLDLIRPPSKS